MLIEFETVIIPSYLPFVAPNVVMMHYDGNLYLISKLYAVWAILIEFRVRACPSLWRPVLFGHTCAAPRAVCAYIVCDSSRVVCVCMVGGGGVRVGGPPTQR